MGTRVHVLKLGVENYVCQFCCDRDISVLKQCCTQLRRKTPSVVDACIVFEYHCENPGRTVTCIGELKKCKGQARLWQPKMLELGVHTLPADKNAVYALKSELDTIFRAFSLAVCRTANKLNFPLNYHKRTIAFACGSWTNDCWLRAQGDTYFPMDSCCQKAGLLGFAFEDVEGGQEHARLFVTVADPNNTVQGATVMRVMWWKHSLPTCNDPVGFTEIRRWLLFLMRQKITLTGAFMQSGEERCMNQRANKVHSKNIERRRRMGVVVHTGYADDVEINILRAELHLGAPDL